MSVGIGERIRALRTERGLSQEEVARRTGVSLGSYGDIERGVTTDPHYSTLRGISHALGVPIDRLLQEEPAPLADAPEAGQTEAEVASLEEPLPKTVAEVRAKFLPIAAILDDYCRAYEQIIERGELRAEDGVAFAHTAVEAHGYHLHAIEVEIRALGHVLDRERKPRQKEQLYDLSVLRPAFARYHALMQTLVERIPDGAEKRALVELTRGA